MRLKVKSAPGKDIRISFERRLQARIDLCVIKLEETGKARTYKACARTLGPSGSGD